MIGKDCLAGPAWNILTVARTAADSFIKTTLADAHRSDVLVERLHCLRMTGAVV